MFTKMISCMKHTKDRMDNFMPIAEMNQLLDTLKSTGATHIEVATVIGHANFKVYSQQWADAIHTKGMFVTWRSAHQNMEGLYSQPKFVGSLRTPIQFWKDEAVKAVQLLGSIIKSGDEWSIYPERTEGIFQDFTSWIDSNGLPGTYAQAFIDIHNACLTVLPFKVKIGLSANNASELLSGWMPKSLIDYAGYAVIDHYVDGNSSQYESDVKAVFQKYGKPVYIQEGAPNRFTKPTRAECDAYYAVNKKLQTEGILGGFGSWSGWDGRPESIVTKVNGLYQLNDNGLSLQAWWGGVIAPPPPLPEPTPEPTPEPISTRKFVAISGSKTYPIALDNEGQAWKLESGKWVKYPILIF